MPKNFLEIFNSESEVSPLEVTHFVKNLMRRNKIFINKEIKRFFKNERKRPKLKVKLDLNML